MLGHKPHVRTYFLNSKCVSSLVGRCPLDYFVLLMSTFKLYLISQITPAQPGSFTSSLFTLNLS